MMGTLQAHLVFYVPWGNEIHLKIPEASVQELEMQQNANKSCDIDMDLVSQIDDLGKQICMISSGGFSSKFAKILFFLYYFFV